MPTAADRLRVRVRRCMKDQRLSQTKLAEQLGRTQSWLSRRLTENPDKRQNFSIKDLDRMADVLKVTVPELFFDDYGQWDRRKNNSDRRKGERRKSQFAIYDARLELTPAIGRLAFPRQEDEE